MSKSNNRVTIIVAIIGLVGTIGAALIANWNKPPKPPVSDGLPSPTLNGTPHGTTVLEERKYAKETAQALIRAWNNRDRDAALKLAEDSAVEKFFNTSPENLKIDSEQLECWPSGTGQVDCQVSAVLGIRLIKTDQGWWVKSVDYLERPKSQ